MTKQEKINLLTTYLNKLYPQTKVFLNSNNEFEFLVAVILSAQSQDKVVNQVTPHLFQKYPSVLSLANGKYEEVLSIIKLVGLGPSKAKNIIELAKIISTKYESKIPHDIKLLEELPGVGHKTASVFLAEIDNAKYIPVDTHISRICKRLNIVSDKLNPTQIQKTLEKYYKGDNYINFHRQMILFGRNICLASSKRKCEECPFKFCKDRKKDR